MNPMKFSINNYSLILFQFFEIFSQYLIQLSKTRIVYQSQNSRRNTSVHGITCIIRGKLKPVISINFLLFHKIDFNDMNLTLNPYTQAQYSIPNRIPVLLYTHDQLHRSIRSWKIYLE